MKFIVDNKNYMVKGKNDFHWIPHRVGTGNWRITFSKSRHLKFSLMPHFIIKFIVYQQLNIIRDHGVRYGE